MTLQMVQCQSLQAHQPPPPPPPRPTNPLLSVLPSTHQPAGVGGNGGTRRSSKGKGKEGEGEALGAVAQFVCGLHVEGCLLMALSSVRGTSHFSEGHFRVSRGEQRAGGVPAFSRTEEAGAAGDPGPGIRVDHRVR